MSRALQGTIVAAVCLVLALVVPVPSASHEHATGVVRERMEAMEKMGRTMKAITQRVKQNRQLEKIPAEARDIQAMAEKLTSWFPLGSDQHPSEAAPAIWTRWGEFEDRAKALGSASAALAGLEPGNAKAFADGVRGVARACAACHDTFRIK